MSLQANVELVETTMDALMSENPEPLFGMARDLERDRCVARTSVSPL